MTVYNPVPTLDGDDVDNEESFKFTLGAGEDATYSCHFACHFLECEYEMAKLKSGSRILLRYSLFHEQIGDMNMPTANSVFERTSDLTTSLDGLSSLDRIIVVPLKDEYKLQSLGHNGVTSLLTKHRQKAEAIKAAGKDWELLVVNAELLEIFGYDDDLIKTSVTDIFDECGNDVTNEMGWIKNAIDFDDFLEFDAESPGMMLALHNDYEYIVCTACWGDCKSTEPGTDYGSRKTYRATFLVAYDPSFETEVRCLGGVEEVAKVCETVVSTRDYDLLYRLMSVVEAKEKSKFNSESCEKLIQMLIKSRKDPTVRAALVNKVIKGLEPSKEPDEQLYETIIGAVDKFGHGKLRESIEELLSQEYRKVFEDISFYLRRVDLDCN